MDFKEFNLISGVNEKRFLVQLECSKCICGLNKSKAKME